MRVTTRNFDERAREFDVAHRQKAAAEALMKKMKPAFVAFLKRCGETPETGLKSFAFESALYHAIASYGETATVDSDAVERFRKAFNKRGRSVTFSELFEERTNYVSMPGGSLLAKGLTKELQGLYKKTRDIKPQSPSLKVDKIAA